MAPLNHVQYTKIDIPHHVIMDIEFKFSIMIGFHNHYSIFFSASSSSSSSSSSLDVSLVSPHHILEVDSLWCIAERKHFLISVHSLPLAPTFVCLLVVCIARALSIWYSYLIVVMISFRTGFFMNEKWASSLKWMHNIWSTNNQVITIKMPKSRANRMHPQQTRKCFSADHSINIFYSECRGKKRWCALPQQTHVNSLR